MLLRIEMDIDLTCDLILWDLGGQHCIVVSDSARVEIKIPQNIWIFPALQLCRLSVLYVKISRY